MSSCCRADASLRSVIQGSLSAPLGGEENASQGHQRDRQGGQRGEDAGTPCGPPATGSSVHHDRQQAGRAEQHFLTLPRPAATAVGHADDPVPADGEAELELPSLPTRTAPIWGVPALGSAPEPSCERGHVNELAAGM